MASGHSEDVGSQFLGLIDPNNCFYEGCRKHNEKEEKMAKIPIKKIKLTDKIA